MSWYLTQIIVCHKPAQADLPEAVAVLLVVLVDIPGQQTRPPKNVEFESFVVESQELQSSSLLMVELVVEDHIQQVEQSHPAASPTAWIQAPAAAACETDHAALAVFAYCSATLKPGLVCPGDWQVLQTVLVLNLCADVVEQNYQKQKQKVPQLLQQRSMYASVNVVGRRPVYGSTGNKNPLQGHQAAGSLQDSEQASAAD